MAEYYVIPDDNDAVTFLKTRINDNPIFPARGFYRGKPAADDKCKTTIWTEKPIKMKDGRNAIPRIPTKRLDICNVHANTRRAMLTALEKINGTIEDLSSKDFPDPEPMDS